MNKMMLLLQSNKCCQ